MDNASSRYNWERRGIIAIVVLVMSLVLYVPSAYIWGPYSVFEASMYLSGASVFATIALASVIFYQTKLNEDQLEQNRQQSLILQESEWMPLVEFRTPGLLHFLRNPPYNIEVKLELKGEVIDWVTLREPDPDTGSENRWKVQVRPTFMDRFEVNTDEIYGTLWLRFESITGAEYLYEYDVVARVHQRDFAFRRATLVNRELPWGELKV